MQISWGAYKTSLTYCLIVLLFFLPISISISIKLEDSAEPEPSFVEMPDLPSEIPDFASIMDVQVKKHSFFDFIEPFVDQVNIEIIQQRQRVLAIQTKIHEGEELSASDLRYLSTLAELYELDTDDLTDAEFLAGLLLRVDKIPASLALAQAANESAWGTSRFAQHGNNYFGQWCYSDGCGLVPNRRREGATHEVRSFDSVKDSVQAYIHNLNTFPSYQMLRRIRQQLRFQNKPVDGASLTDGLESYSSRGHDYIDELQNMIYSNNLLSRDNPTL
jgi:Bax protein